MATILQTLADFFSHFDNSTIAIAYSGGIDSQVLLHSLHTLKQQHKLQQTIQVYHVNHGLSDNANAWQAFAEEQCQALNVQLTVLTVDIAVQSRKSLEEQAREARYQVLQSACQTSDILVTGHHGDDQTETFLLALKRGSGIKGLSAMSAVMPLGQQLLARPLLAHCRADIELYAQQHNLTWVDDESNLDTHYDRNFLRHQILPRLQQRWPSISQTIERSAQHCAEAQELLEELAQGDLQRIANDKFSLSVDALTTLSTARFNNVMRYFFKQHQILMPSSKQLQQIHKQLNAAVDKNPVVQLAQHCMRRYQGALYLTPIFSEDIQWQQVVDWPDLQQQSCHLSLPDNIGELLLTSASVDIDLDLDIHTHCQPWRASISAPKSDQQMSIRLGHHNPRCLPDYRQKSRQLKKVLQELNIPSWQRKRLPLLFYNDQLVAVLGHFVCKPFLAKSNTASLHLYWQPRQ